MDSPRRSYAVHRPRHAVRSPRQGGTRDAADAPACTTADNRVERRLDIRNETRTANDLDLPNEWAHCDALELVARSFTADSIPDWYPSNQSPSARNSYVSASMFHTKR